MCNWTWPVPRCWPDPRCSSQTPSVLGSAYGLLSITGSCRAGRRGGARTPLDWAEHSCPARSPQPGSTSSACSSCPVRDHGSHTDFTRLLPPDDPTKAPAPVTDRSCPASRPGHGSSGRGRCSARAPAGHCSARLALQDQALGGTLAAQAQTSSARLCRGPTSTSPKPALSAGQHPAQPGPISDEPHLTPSPCPTFLQGHGSLQ